jgi:uncharacterized membrane protein
MAGLLADQIKEEDRKRIVKAIEMAELNSSGEIRVHFESHCKENILDHAAFIFNKLGMHQTDQRNGILFYIALKDKKFAVIGDAGIHEKVGDDFWEKVKNEMIPYFKEGRLSDGLIEGINKAGNELKAYFPYQKDDKNELDNEISFS